MRPKFLCGVAVLFLHISLILPVANTAETRDFPSRPVEIIISFSPGGTLDLATRILGPELSRVLKVPVIITNKAGGGGAVGTEYAASARPDGYTILAAPIAFSILPILNPAVHYKLSDFIPLCKYADAPNLIQVKRNSPLKSFGDLINYAKANPGKLTAGSSGVGTGGHFSLEMIKIQAGIDVSHLPYKSGGELLIGILGDQVDFAMNSYTATLGLMKSGELRALASTTGKKIPDLPNVPTIAELGYPKAITGSWTGFMIPKGVPKPVLNKLAAALEKAILSPTVKKNLENAAQVIDYQDGPTFTKFLYDEHRAFEDIAKKAKLVK